MLSQKIREAKKELEGTLAEIRVIRNTKSDLETTANRIKNQNKIIKEEKEINAKTVSNLNKEIGDLVLKKKDLIDECKGIEKGVKDKEIGLRKKEDEFSLRQDEVNAEKELIGKKEGEIKSREDNLKKDRAIHSGEVKRIQIKEASLDEMIKDNEALNISITNLKSEIQKEYRESVLLKEQSDKTVQDNIKIQEDLLFKQRKLDEGIKQNDSEARSCAAQKQAAQRERDGAKSEREELMKEKSKLDQNISKHKRIVEANENERRKVKMLEAKLMKIVEVKKLEKELEDL